jgi:Zn finger protein HypA/HybF involved in hydrogenase expression
MAKFTRTIEDFVCEYCGFNVSGSGYTNHCPKCLYSKHVDINPGDRMNACGGTMEPVGVEFVRGDYILIHQCQKCGQQKRNKISPADDFNAVILLAKRVAKNLNF